MQCQSYRLFRGLETQRSLVFLRIHMLLGELRNNKGFLG